MKFIAYIIVLVSFKVIIADKARFDNYRVYSIEVENDEQLEVLQELENYQDGIIFLTPPTVIQTRIEIVVPPHKFADISELCEKHQMKFEIKVENLQRCQFDLHPEY